jgi:flavorubredoxin
MPKILVLYYSRTGNTKKMAEAVAEGAKTVQGVQVEVSYYVSVEELSGYDAVLAGVPTYHHDMTVDIKRLFEDAAEKGVSLKGKIGAAFGSYGWSGEAPRLVLEIMRNRFEMDAADASLLARYALDQAALDKCKDLGRRVAERLMHGA